MRNNRFLILLFTIFWGANLSAQPIADNPKSAHLLASEYRDWTLASKFPFHANYLNFKDPLSDLKAIDKKMLAASKSNSVQPSHSVTVPAQDAQPAVQLYFYQPKTVQQDKLPVIYFIHGGGYIIGNARMDNRGLTALAKQTKAVVISVEYRLATEAPFPADLDDVYHGLSYVFDNAENLGIDAQKIVLMGESAGGGLAARLALKTRDIGKYRPAGQVLIYPMLDHRTGTESSPYKHPYAGEFVWTPELNRLAWDMLRGDQIIPPSQMPYYSPSSAENLADLPNTFMVVGTLDLFAAENIDYANRLIQAGVPTDFLLINGVYHAFELSNPKSPQTQRYISARTDAIKRMFEAAK